METGIVLNWATTLITGKSRFGSGIGHVYEPGGVSLCWGVAPNMDWGPHPHTGQHWVKCIGSLVSLLVMGVVAQQHQEIGQHCFNILLRPTAMCLVLVPE